MTFLGVLLRDSVSPLFVGSMAPWNAWDRSQAGGRDRRVLILPLALPKHILLGFCTGSILHPAVGVAVGVGEVE